MARSRVPEKSVKIAEFAKLELGMLVETLSTEQPGLRVTDAAVMGALVLAARRVPPEGIAAVVSTYWDSEAEVAAVVAIGDFLRASSA